MNTGDADGSSASHDSNDLQNLASMAGFLEIAFDAVVVCDAQERITDWNPAAEQLYGWTAQEARGKTPAELFWPVNPKEKKIHEQRQSRLKRGETLRGEHETCRKDGSFLHVKYVVRAIFDADKKLSGYLTIYRDVSTREQDIAEREQKEESLRARTEEVETLLKVSPVAVFLANDPECIHISGNPAAYRLVELSGNMDANISKSAPVQERPTYQVFRNGIEVPAQDLPMQKAARLGVEVNEDELALRFEDGSQKFIYAFAKPLFDAQGRSRGAIAAMLDITERKRAEAQLERSNQKLNEILTSIQDDFYVLDRDWMFVFASRSFTSKIGKAPEDFVGNNIWKMFPKHLGTTFEENFRAAMEKREIRRFEIPGKYTSAWYKMTAFPSAEGITVMGTDITESKQAEEALQENEKRYRLLVKYAPAGIYEIDPMTRRFLEVNDTMCEILGYTREELLAKMPDDLLDDEGRERFRQRMLQTLAGEKVSQQTEYKVRTKDGREIWSILNLTINYEGGKPRSISVIAHDISERKQAEAEVQASQQILETVVRHMPAAVALIRGSDLRLQLINPAYQAIAPGKKMLGFTLDELWPETGQNFTAICRRVLETGEPYQVVDELNMIRRQPDGPLEPAYFSWSMYRVRLPGKEGWGVLNTAWETTARKRGEEQLHELSQRLTYHVDNSPLAVIEWGPDMRLVRWSGAAERMFGWKAEEVLGRRMEDLHWIYEEDTSQVSNVSADLQTGADSRRFSANRNYRKDGSVAYCEWYNSSLLDGSGKLRSILSLVLDVTERKRAEEALQEHQKQLQLLNETLEQKVQEKTGEVHRLASDTIKAVQQERHRISHILHDDLQQRIYAIQMQLTFLHDELRNESARREASEIEKQLAEILEVTRHLSIDLSPPILRGEGLSQAINWLAAQMRQRYGLPIELQADGPFALYDEELHVLLFNCVRELLFNVVKHAQASRAMVTLQWLDAGLQIEVRDDGRGFPPDMLAQQANGGIGGGDVLPSSSGLPTIHHQLSLFGGRMEMRSELGAGTRIFLIVPAAGGGE